MLAIRGLPTTRRYTADAPIATTSVKSRPDSYEPTPTPLLHHQDNNAELNAVIHAQDRDAASRAAAKAAAANGGATAKDTLSASRPRPVVLEGWDQVEAIAAAIARPYEPQAQSWELIEQV